MSGSVDPQLWSSDPRFTKGTCLDSSDTVSAALATETADPLPRPPPRNKSTAVAYATIDSHTELFKIVTPINIDLFEAYLRDHPNKPYVDSVCLGLRQGFWPWANAEDPNMWKQYDNSHRQPERMTFVRQQRDEEIQLGRWSTSFDSELLPGMYSSPIGVVPKPRSDKFRLVNDHSQSPYSPNSMITTNEPSFPLDTIPDLVHVLLCTQECLPTDAHASVVADTADCNSGWKTLC